MNQAEFCRRTGATVRQVDLWYKAGMDMCIKKVEGSGVWRQYKEDSVPRVRLLVDVQKTFGHKIEKWILKEIFDNYWDECVRVGRIWLTWRVDHGDPAYASSRGGATIS